MQNRMNTNNERARQSKKHRRIKNQIQQKNINRRKKKQQLRQMDKMRHNTSGEYDS